MFAFWIFKSRQDQNRPNSPPHSQLPTTSQALAGHYCGNTIDWFAIMQHYGAPTRMLDWTQSPYVALYFAMDHEANRSEDAALWAIDFDWLRKRSELILAKHCQDYIAETDVAKRCDFMDSLIIRDGFSYPIIIQATPRKLPKRMAAQKGQLLYNVREDVSFPVSLLGTVMQPEMPQSQVASKIIVKNELRKAFLDKLREMNIHKESLFPDEDSIAPSLAVRLRLAVAEQVEETKKAIMKNHLEYAAKKHPRT